MEPVGIILIIVAWVGTGLVIAFAMRRRGRDLAVGLAVGAALGPFDAPVFVGPSSFDREKVSQAGVPIGTGA